MTLERDGGADLPATAIIGMACRFPGSRTPDAFWANLRHGRSHVRAFEDTELRASGISDAAVAAPNYVKAGAPLEDIEWFDHAFFGLSAEEALLLDPQHRIFLECAWEALEDAGYARAAGRPAVGILAGCAMSSYIFRLLSPGDLLHRFGEEAIRHANDKDYLTALAAYLLDLRGPSVTVQSGCATGLVALHLACQSLTGGECDMALAGAVSIRVPEHAGYSYAEGSILSPEGRCRPFAADATGTVYGNGGGVVLLKPLEAAIADRDNIRAVIIGSAVNNSGRLRTAPTAPSAEGQRRAIEEALAVAGVQPFEIGYVEAHGTGTLLGDAIELESLGSVFGETPCTIGAVKGNIGHLGVAAGIAGIIKAVLCLQHRMLPAHVGSGELNPLVKAAGLRVETVANSRTWPAPDGPRRAGVSAFGMTGSNAHVVLQEAPLIARKDYASPPLPRLLALSARSEPALRRLAGSVGEHLANARGLGLEDIAYTLQVGRRHFNHRIAEVFATTADAGAALAPPAAHRLRIARADPSPPAPILLFPDPRVFRREDGRSLYRWHAAFRSAVDQCYRAAEEALDRDWGAGAAPADRQPAAPARVMRGVALQLGLARVWEALGVTASAMAASGLGAIAAACAAGALSSDDAARLAMACADDSGTSPLPDVILQPSRIPIACSLSGSWLDIGHAMSAEGLAALFRSGESANTDFDQAALVKGRFAVVLGWRQNAGRHGAFSLARDASSESEIAVFLAAVGALWGAGHDLNWDALYPDEEPRRVSLPTSPFERARSWFTPTAPARFLEDGAAATGSGVSSGRSDVRPARLGS